MSFFNIKSLTWLFILSHIYLIYMTRTNNTTLTISLLLNVLLIIVLASVISFNYMKKEGYIDTSNNNNNFALKNIDINNATFITDYGTTTLKDGKSIVNSGPSIVSTDIIPKISIDTDLDKDGVNDTLFFVRQDGGGTGKFLYLVAVLSSQTNNNYVNGYGIGDRVIPEGIIINKDGNIVVSYLDRKDDEPFSSIPSIKKNKTFSFEKDKRQFVLVSIN